jgi:renalase
MYFIIIGGGLSGLTAGLSLQQKGHQVTILEKGRGVGGRLASRSVGEARFDHGAQYFSAKTPDFQHFVSELRQAGVVKPWTPTEASHERFVSVDGMNGIAKYLAQSLVVKASERAVRLESLGAGVRVHTEAGNVYTADAVVITSPVPQTIELLEHSEVRVPVTIAQALRTVEYEPCLAVMALLNRPSQVPAPGGVKAEGEAFSWIADNQLKGISAVPCVTIHASAAFSRAYLDTDLNDAARLLLAAAEAYVAADSVASWQIHRWRYSLAQSRLDATHLRFDAPYPIVLAGDAFGIGNVEGAYLSGLAAGGFQLPVISYQ